MPHGSFQSADRLKSTLFEAAKIRVQHLFPGRTTANIETLVLPRNVGSR